MRHTICATDNATAKTIRTWRQRLSYAVNLSPVRVIFNSHEIDMRAMLQQRAIRCAIHQENAGITGRACFN